MRKLLLLALLLYDIIASAARPGNYDYDYVDGTKRHSVERRSWRKNALMKSDMDRKDWDDGRRDFDSMRYLEEVERRGQERSRDLLGYRRAYDDVEKINMALGGRSLEQHNTYIDKEIPEKKINMAQSCDRPHERYEACFAGCASVSCDNPRDRLRPCYPFCEPGCVCVPPYVRDDRTHKCVLPDDCTKGLKGIPDIGDETERA